MYQYSDKKPVVMVENIHGLNADYHGQVNDEQVPDGIGRWIWHGSSVYEGHWVKGQFTGWGREFYTNGSYYVG